MAIISSGALTFAAIQTEFGGSNPIGLNEYYAGGSYVPAATSGINGAIPSSGQITLNQFYGATASIPRQLWSAGAAWTWRDSGSSIARSSPVQLGSDTSWGFNYKWVAPSTIHMVKQDGTLWVSGGGGQLSGLNDTSIDTRLSPVQVGALTNWSPTNEDRATVTSDNFCATLMVKQDGTLWMWGYNTPAQGGYITGDTGVTYYSSPVQIGAVTTWTNAMGGASNSYIARRSNGTLWSWGNGAGYYAPQIAQPSGINYNTPTQIGALTNWGTSIALHQYGPGGALAIKTDGTLWSWGDDTNAGALAQGGSVTSSPVQVGALTNWLVVTSSWSTTNAGKTDGTLWGWGSYTGIYYGDTSGLGGAPSGSPQQIGGSTNWVSSTIKRLGSSYNNRGIAKTDGTLWVTGRNNRGEHGLGDWSGYYGDGYSGGGGQQAADGATDSTRSYFTQVGALTTWNGAPHWGGTTSGSSSIILAVSKSS
jgi:hypothetical protein